MIADAGPACALSGELRGRVEFPSQLRMGVPG
jgi:hypothetical protein